MYKMVSPIESKSPSLAANPYIKVRPCYFNPVAIAGALQASGNISVHVIGETA
jgi:hypothetical protein